ncbi:hypothetical protein ebA4361 [Aromatoleum aromaticum EbN1]|uniref:Uncharacterized protein n=1 Tax=Aromatoleum aromaticum (strain DSM 19018 / LMG 30748 / EbN1) TaxID=76114 RepID=Q5P267_AROAE|nr:hypothetical protein ebA4361 [Aromatoleum aromaticum EbN1]
MEASCNLRSVTCHACCKRGHYRTVEEFRQCIHREKRMAADLFRMVESFHFFNCRSLPSPFRSIEVKCHCVRSRSEGNLKPDPVARRRQGGVDRIRQHLDPTNLAAAVSALAAASCRTTTR